MHIVSNIPFNNIKLLNKSYINDSQQIEKHNYYITMIPTTCTKYSKLHIYTNRKLDFSKGKDYTIEQNLTMLLHLPHPTSDQLERYPRLLKPLR